MKKIDSIVLSGKETLPLIEGGKGIAISSGESSGAWAKAGGVGTFSGVNADSYDKNGNLKVISFYAKKARGMMVRFIVKNKCKNLQEILSFNLGGYSYSEEHTIDSNSPVFIR